MMRADVCVIGSGAGGAPVAAELAEAGLNVVVLEEGERHPPEAMTARPRDTMVRLYRDGAQTMTIGSPPILLPLGRGIGGTTVVNSGTCFRTPPRVLARWEREFGLDAGGLDACFERVERTIGVTRVTEDIAGRNALLARRGAERLGWSGGFLERNVRGCRGSGVCAFGCPTGAKQHAGVTYMARAEEAGATVLTNARAKRIDVNGSRAIGVTAEGMHVQADRVVVAAGTIHTPGLLAASGLGDRRHLGRHLSLHPATAAWGLFDEEVDMDRGVPQSYYVDEFASEGIMLETIAGPPDYLAMGLPLAGPAHRELMLRYRHIGQCGLMVSDTSRGRVHLRGRRPLIRYDLEPADVARVEQGLERVVELLKAAGARRVYRPPGRKLMAFHPLGTARAHAHPGRGVVDADLKVHGTDNVWVADGSVVPSALGVNPQITIMALATRLAFHLRGEPCPSSSTDPGSTAQAASTLAPASAPPRSSEPQPLPASGR
jgi:choline dehydrogenase-like flavoprotein